MTTILELRNVAFDYPGRQVLDDTSLRLTKGSLTALIGPNGAGKTTLLRIASGFLKPTVGEVLFQDEPLFQRTNRERARLIALVPQQLDVPFDYTVQQIVEQGRTPYLGFLRGPLREDHLAVDRALDLTDLSSFRDRAFNELSGGERQRVKIALGLAQDAKLLLLDEPTQNLDIGRQVELIELLHTLQDEGLTIFTSIHDLHLVRGNFSEVHILSSSKGLMSGTPNDILTPSLLADAFNCLPGRHPLLEQDHSRCGE